LEIKGRLTFSQIELNGMDNHQPNNEKTAALLEQIADLLEAQKANVHRVRAYRTGAQSIRNSERSVVEMVEEDDDLVELQNLHGIGKGLARTIAEYVETGRSSLLDRLTGEVSPEDLFLTVPGIGETLAHRIVEELDIHTLEELELAAHDGRLEEIDGFGEKRLETIRVSLAGLLSRSVRRRVMRKVPSEPSAQDHEPSVATLLEVDKSYRQKAQSGELKKIAPRRFNPENEAWLPIMHTEKGEWSFTALFSNTKRAHELGTTKDWVVLYYEKEGIEGQATVVTESHGALEGKRVIRGREEECKIYYQGKASG
jgi:DNA polymerase (family 10)